MKSKSSICNKPSMKDYQKNYKKITIYPKKEEVDFDFNFVKNKILSYKIKEKNDELQIKCIRLRRHQEEKNNDKNFFKQDAFNYSLINNFKRPKSQYIFSKPKFKIYCSKKEREEITNSLLKEKEINSVFLNISKKLKNKNQLNYTSTDCIFKSKTNPICTSTTQYDNFAGINRSDTKLLYRCNGLNTQNDTKEIKVNYKKIMNNYKLKSQSSAKTILKKKEENNYRKRIKTYFESYISPYKEDKKENKMKNYSFGSFRFESNTVKNLPLFTYKLADFVKELKYIKAINNKNRYELKKRHFLSYKQTDEFMNINKEMKINLLKYKYFRCKFPEKPIPKKDDRGKMIDSISKLAEDDYFYK